jgi:hypothetical protein
MTRDELEQTVEAAITSWEPSGAPRDALVSEICNLILRERSEAFQRGVWAGQESMMES